jgi:secretion/DNA translocation related TadE-like protein
VSRPGEQGSATANAAVLISLLAMVAVLAGAAVSVFTGHRKVTAAADLAALAGAAALQHQRPGCPAADRIAARNHATLVACEVAGEVLTVRVERVVDSVFDLSVTVHARARAGPADPPGR